MLIGDDRRTVVAGLTRRTELLVREVLIDIEDQHHGIADDLPDDVRAALRAAARTAGVFAPQVSAEFGGSGLNMRDRLPVVEASGYSLFGPLAQNCAAPDDGNILLLEQVGSARQKDRYLVPLAAGRIRSCFVSTESAVVDKAGRPELPLTAERTGAGWLINGRRQFVRGVAGASVAIVTAKTSGGAGSHGGTTMFVVDATAGYTLRGDADPTATFGGNGELVFDDLEIGDDAVLGEVGRGFDYAVAMAGPVTLTGCMRCMGSARRAADIAIDRAAARTSAGHGAKIAGAVEQLLVDNEIDILAARALVDRACLLFDVGEPSAQAISIAKTSVIEAVARVVDRSLQICDVLGAAGDAVLSRLHRQARCRLARNTVED